MKKLFISVIGVIFIIFTIYFVNSYNPKIFFPFKQMMPKELKVFLKRTIFFIPENKKQIKVYEETINNLQTQNFNLTNDLVEIQKSKNKVNEKIFPKTQFLALEFSEVEIDIGKNLDKKFDAYRDGKPTTPFYLENIENKTIAILFNGEMQVFEDYNVENKKFKKNFNLNNDLAKNITVLDTLLVKNEIFVSYTIRENGCDYIAIKKANLNFNFLSFESFFIRDSSSDEFKEKCTAFQLGGRIAFFQKDNQDFILLSAMDITKVDLYETLKDQFNKNLLIKFSNILAISIDKKKSKVFSSGHRNPQGLTVFKNVILSTEHGPRGGDEVNKIIEGKNYGWPLVSYGENYNDNFHERDEYKFLKNHKEYGFEEPIYSFVPSIGISQLINVPERFSKRWKDNFLISSLRSGSLFRVYFNDKFTKIISMEKINIGKRIRDISYNEKINYFTIAQENNPPSIGILTVKK